MGAPDGTGRMGSPRNWLLFFASIAWPACGGETGGTAGHGADAGSDGGAWLRFELGEAPMAFGRVPWPDDLYLDARGRPKVLRLPAQDGAADPRLIDALRAGIESLDGFGANASVYFGVEGRLDPSSLPHSEAESMRPDATVFLVDVDPLSPTAHARLPVRVHLVGDWLVVRPAVGVALRPGGRYAAVVTTSVRAADGPPLRPSPSWRRVRDATSRPDDPLDARAHALHGPVLTTLGGLGIARDRIAGMAVFRVQRVAEPLEALRRRVRAGDAPVVREVRVLRGPELDTHLGRPVDGARGLGVDGGVAHDHVAALVHAVFDTPGFEHEEPGVHGVIAFDDDGRPVARRIERVPLTLVLPRSADVSALRVAIYQHGIGEERGEMLGVADALASAGWAVVGIDAPYHGLRPMGQRPDAMGRFTGAVAPDGFG
ncbi:MAG: hypothetical protein NZ898_10965, partial [Myxococcota bacterium]|nr:hypothetical protein [Myxococcota bacterium]